MGQHHASGMILSAMILWASGVRAWPAGLILCFLCLLLLVPLFPVPARRAQAWRRLRALVTNTLLAGGRNGKFRSPSASTRGPHSKIEIQKSKIPCSHYSQI